VSHYTARFDILLGAERITRINGTIWADNAIYDVIVNGTSTGLTSGVEATEGPSSPSAAGQTTCTGPAEPNSPWSSTTRREPA
jgi:hypothetical protein